MIIVQNEARCFGVKFAMQNDRGNEVGRAFLYAMYNDLHDKPFGLMEDVYIAKEIRSQGLGMSLVKQVIKVARERGCYKLIATSRYSRSRVHKLYLELGFRDHGKEFRIDF